MTVLLSDNDVQGMTAEQVVGLKRELETLLLEKESRARFRSFFYTFPDAGPLRREKYVKHMKFMAAGAKYRQRLALWGNRIGKTRMAAFENTCHLTGKYPEWWTGHRFYRPVDIWMAGNTSISTRDILQKEMLGDPALMPGSLGSGMIPQEYIKGNPTKKHGVPNALETVVVKHYDANGDYDGDSVLTFKSYEQGRKSFEGTKKDLIELDEEPPMDIHTECLLRTMTTGGLLMLTFTPLQGLTAVVLMYLPNGKIPNGKTEVEGSVYVSMATWDDAPHLTKQMQDDLWASIPPFQRDARKKGIPQLGSGAIYPVSDELLEIADFEIPAHFKKGFACDVGWNKTAALWGALDEESDILYIYSEHYLGEAQPAIHASAINARGKWISGTIDPAARGRSQIDGESLMNAYRDLGLSLVPANNAVEAGLYEVWTRMSTGRLRIFKSLSHIWDEKRIYRRNEKGAVVKDFDHLMDCLRYLVMMIRIIGAQKPAGNFINEANRRLRLISGGRRTSSMSA